MNLYGYHLFLNDAANVLSILLSLYAIIHCSNTQRLVNDLKTKLWPK